MIDIIDFAKAHWQEIAIVAGATGLSGEIATGILPFLKRSSYILKTIRSISDTISKICTILIDYGQWRFLSPEEKLKLCEKKARQVINEYKHLKEKLKK
jgi:hypothetical protein